MNAKHTPGPWKWWTSCSYRRLSSETTGHDGDVLHAVVQRSDNHPDVHFPNGGFRGPDACLIAAAPELLSALDRLQHSYRLLLARKPVRDVEETLAEVDHAIAKATGSAA